MIFIPHDVIPQHYHIHPDWVISTEDTRQDGFRWSRMLSNNYIEGRGFLTHFANKRLRLRCYTRQSDYGSYTEVDPAVVEKALACLLEEGKGTILHYHPDGFIQDIIVNVAPGVLEALPEQYKRFYYDIP